MDFPDRALLLVISALPACGPESETSDEGGDAMPGDPAQLGASCERFFTKSVECYGGDEETYDIAQECDYYEQYFEMYGPACAGAQEEMFSCLAPLDCDQIDDPLGGGCHDSYAAAHEACPEMFPFCISRSLATTPTGCGVEGDSCLDGKIYGVWCEQRTSGGEFECTCTIDSETVRSFNVDTCDDGALGDLTLMHCDFPPGA